MSMHPKLWGLLLAGLLALGCEKSLSFQEIEKVNKEVAADVQSDTGHEALVSLMKDGSNLEITVTLVSTSPAELERSKPKVEAIVKRHWPKASKIVVEARPE